MTERKSRLSLYIHIPFCVRKCLYCDFLSSAATQEMIGGYVDALSREIELAGQRYSAGNSGTSYVVDTIFWGGGTPTILSVKQFDHIMTRLAMNFVILDDAEITTECNPGTVDQQKLDALREMGFNRLSIGVQSFCDDELRALGRIHTAKEALEAIDEAFCAGFTNLSIDLMSAIPGQTPVSYERSLKTAVESGVSHLSAYSLIVEEGTPYDLRYGNGKRDNADPVLLKYLDQLPELPSEETERQMYYRTRDLLGEYGFERYEISNYAKRGYRSRHNEGYWTEHQYLGLGIGAASLLFAGQGAGEGMRFRNTGDLRIYCGEFCGRNPSLDHVICDRSIRTKEDAMEEYMFLGLRRMEGISEEKFRERFGASVEDIYAGIPDKHIEEGLLKRENGHLFLTDRGIDISNIVMAEYLLTSNVTG